MLFMILNWILVSIALIFISQFIPGIVITDFTSALIAIGVMSIINVSIKPVIGFFTLPLNFLTLGLFTFIINAMMFSLSAWFVPGFEVTSFWSALFGSLLLSIISMLTSSIAKTVTAGA